MLTKTHSPPGAVYLTIADAARVLGLSGQTIRRLIHEEGLPSYRIGAVRIVIRRDELEAFVAERRTSGKAECRDGRRHGKRVGPQNGRRTGPAVPRK